MPLADDGRKRSASAALSTPAFRTTRGSNCYSSKQLQSLFCVQLTLSIEQLPSF